MQYSKSIHKCNGHFWFHGDFKVLSLNVFYW